MPHLKWQVMKGMGGVQWLVQIPNTSWALIFSSLVFLFLGLCEWVCSQTEKGWCVCKGGAQCWSCISFLLHGIYCTSAAQRPEKGNIAKLWLTWLKLGHLDLNISDVERKGVPFFRRRRKSLEEHVDLWDLRFKVLRPQAEGCPERSSCEKEGQLAFACLIVICDM